MKFDVSERENTKTCIFGEIFIKFFEKMKKAQKMTQNAVKMLRTPAF